MVTKNRSQINGSGRKPIVLNGNSQPPTAEFRLNEIILNWADVVAAFKARHPIVHGTHGFIMDEEAISHMNNLLKASDSLENYLGSRGKTAFERIVRRRSRG